MSNPLVTAVMVTGMSVKRYPLARIAVECFKNQTYPNKELLIINHGDQSLFSDDPFIRELRVIKKEGENIGDLRNIGLKMARGEFIINWDDDDWHHPMRMQMQVEAQENDAAVLLFSQIRCNLLNGCALYKQYPAGMPGSILHPRNVSFRYQNLVRRSDTLFRDKFAKKIIVENDPIIYVRFYHGLNLWSATHIMHHLAVDTIKNRLEISPKHQMTVSKLLRVYRSAFCGDAAGGGPLDVEFPNSI